MAMKSTGMYGQGMMGKGGKSGYGSPTSNQKRMSGFAKKGHKSFKTANVMGSGHSMSGKKLPSARGMKGGY